MNWPTVCCAGLKKRMRKYSIRIVLDVMEACAVGAKTGLLVTWRQIGPDPTGHCVQLTSPKLLFLCPPFPLWEREAGRFKILLLKPILKRGWL